MVNERWSVSHLSATHGEILSQPQAWQDALQSVAGARSALLDLWADGRYEQVLFTGCGSTYYLALAAAALFQDLTGVPARGVPAGELVMFPGVSYPAQGRMLLVAISRSAETTETLLAARAFVALRRGDVVAVTNFGDGALAATAKVTLGVPAGQERSVAQTRSFASMYVATTAVACTLAGLEDLTAAMRALPMLGSRLIERYEGLAQDLGSRLDFDRMYFLGSGPRYGLACEASLKMKEMSLTHSEPFHFLEFRHGPLSMAGPSTLMVGLQSESNHSYENAVLVNAAEFGAHLLRLGEADGDVVFASGLPEAVRNVLYLPVLQLLGYYRALAKGFDPDRPRNIAAVVKLE